MKQYHDLVRHIFDKGTHRGDRTGTGVQSVFGYQCRYNLQEGFPLVTTKHVPFRLPRDETLWMLAGSTNNFDLLAKNVHIWDEWAVYDKAERSPRRRADAMYAEANAREIDHESGWHDLSNDQLDVVAKQFAFLTPETQRLVSGPLDGSLGPIYGAQWRSWPGAIRQKTEGDYQPSDGAMIVREYVGGGPMDVYYQETIDQIAELVKGLKEKPFSRRHVVTAWNPAVLPNESISPQDNVREGRASLASCHCLFQFYVRERTTTEIWNAVVERGDSATLYAEMQDVPGAVLRAWFERKGIPTKALSCQLYQRSADSFLGVPFNIAGYALLTELVAQCVGMVADEFIHTFGDLHIYSNHREQLELQLTREPYPLPRLKLNPSIKDIFAFTAADIELIGYQHHPAIKGAVAV